MFVRRNNWTDPLDSCTTSTEPPARERVAFRRHLLGVGMRHDDTQTLNPLLGVFPVFRFKNQCLVAGKYFECFRNVSCPTWHLHRLNLVDVDAFTTTLNNWNVTLCFLLSLLLTDPRTDKWAPESVKYLVRHLLNNRHLPFFSLSWPSITGWASPVTISHFFKSLDANNCKPNKTLFTTLFWSKVNI